MAFDTKLHWLRLTNPVMPAQAGIHEFAKRLHLVEKKSWIPACAGMTVELPSVRTKVSWFKRSPGGGCDARRILPNS